MDLETVDELLTTTRAVRKRLDLTRPVPAEMITECVRLATQAPSADDVQNWRWVAVVDEDRRRAVAEAYRAATAGAAEQVSAALETAGAAERRRLESALHLITHLHEVPVHMLAYALEVEGLPAGALYGSIYPAVWSFQLALRSRGLGTAPMFVWNEQPVNEVVDAPPNARIAALLPVAYYTGETFKPARRRPVEEVLFWDRWARPSPSTA